MTGEGRVMAGDDHGMQIECDDDGWWYASCDCGWESDMPCPGRGEASDEWADHIQETDQ